MRKILKNIPPFFLLLAGLIVIAHMIIPHDHHLSESGSDLNDTCPFSKNKTSHSTHFPVHCHAFNDIASEKAIILILRDDVNNNAPFFTDFPDISAPDIQIKLVCLLWLNQPLTDSHPFNSSLLRAPPFLI